MFHSRRSLELVSCHWEHLPKGGRKCDSCTLHQSVNKHVTSPIDNVIHDHQQLETVFIREREREGGREGEREREGGREGGRERGREKEKWMSESFN